MSVLLLGATGYIAQGFIDEMARRDIPFFAVSRCVTDYTKLEVFTGLLDQIRPELVINCAGLIGNPTADPSDAHRHEIIRANAWLPLMLVQQCDWFLIPFAHISTGHLYSGDNEMIGWAECNASQHTFDTGADTCVASKDLAEKIIRLYHRHYLWRIRLPFDHLDSDRNYISKLMRLEKIFTALDSISHRGDFVKACLDLWKLRAPFGTYNVTNQGAVSSGWICRRINEDLLPKKKFKLYKPDDKPQKLNCVLSVAKLLDAGVKMRIIDDAINDSLAKWQWRK